MIHMDRTPQNIASKGFIVLCGSAGHGEFQKKTP